MQRLSLQWKKKKKKGTKAYVPQTLKLVAKARSSMDSESVTYCSSKLSWASLTLTGMYFTNKPMMKMQRNTETTALLSKEGTCNAAGKDKDIKVYSNKDAEEK
jgi:hypothetical protein